MYYWLEAEVAGGLGDGIDYQFGRVPEVFPPMCYEFESWDGACIVTTSGFWIASDRLVYALRAGGLTGLSFAGKVIVTKDPQWAERQPDVRLPEWEWIIPQGIPHQDDFWLKDSVKLAISERALSLIQQMGIGTGMEFPEDTHPEGPPRLDIQARMAEFRRRGFVRPSDARATWVASPYAPRPQVSSAYQLDPTQRPETVAALQPSTRYGVSLPGEMEADYYTDPASQVRYIETVRSTSTVSNPVLDAPQPNVTYVVHSFDGQYAVILRTDDLARMAEVGTDRLAPTGAFSPVRHPFGGLLGGWPGRVSPSALLASVNTPAADGLAALATRLADAVNHGQHVVVRFQASYLDAGAVPSQLRVDYAIDGQTTTEVFPNV